MSQSTLSALIADPSSAVRTSLRTILQDFDVERIDTATSIQEARRRIVENRYDLVLCEYHFDSEETGQDLLEELREKKLLPLSTLFFMVTGEAGYSQVAGVAEESPDDYMLKPVNAGELARRIEKAFTRRQALMEIYEALNTQRYGRALKLAQQMMAVKTPYLSDIIKLAAGTLFRLGRLEDAAAMYERILAMRNHAWAKLGLARVAMRQGDKPTAEKAMLDIVEQHQRYLPVYNQLLELYLSEEQYADALAISERAIKITPNNLKRLQRAGQLAYSLGDNPKATAYLERAAKVSGKQLDLDYRTLFHLMLLLIDKGQTPDALSLAKQIVAKQKRDGISEDGRRADWYGELALAVEAIVKREPLAAIDLLKQLSTHWDAPEFNFDFALDYLTVIDRIYAEDIASTLLEWLEPIILRFVTGRYAEELLQARLANRPRLSESVTQAGEFIADVTKQAARLVVENNFRDAAEALTREGQRTRNNRLLAAAANAAAKSYKAYQDAGFRQQAETCLALMVPSDMQLTQRLRSQFMDDGEDLLEAAIAG